MFIASIYGETLVKEFNYKNVPLELVSCPRTIWCGTLGYASNCTDEPDIAGLLQKYQKLCHIPKQERANSDWSCCISIDYWKNGAALRGMMFAQQVLSDRQDTNHDVYTMPESLYIRIAGTKEVAQAAFNRDHCELYELFGVIKDALAVNGYTIGTNGAQEIEMYNHEAGLSYAYVQVMCTERTHLQEEIIKTFAFNGINADLVRWSETIWCGKIGYAFNNVDEPDVEKIANDAKVVFSNNIPNRREKNWEVCISLNYLSDERPNGVMFGFLVQTDEQPDSYDIIKLPSALYMRIQICDKTFQALDVDPWTGGIPPYEWIGEYIAPKYGYKYGDDTLPIFEYYLHNPENYHVEACYLYVPVQEA